MTQIEPIGFLRDQAIRMRRTKWPSAWMLADELWLILSALEPPATGKITVSPNPGTTNNYTLPSLPSLNIPQLDLDIPDFGTLRPSNDQRDVGGQKQTTKDTCFWRRSVLLARVDSLPESSGGQCNVTFFPNGSQGTLCEGMFELNPEGVLEWEDTATCLGDPDNLEVGGYVLIYQPSQWLQREVTLRDKNTSAIIDQQTELTRLQYQNLIVPMGAGTGGSVGQTLTAIGPISGATPGSGSVQLFKLDKATGTLVAGATVTAYNSVRTGVSAARWVQLKRIDGAYWVDVEDCTDEEDGA